MVHRDATPISSSPLTNILKCFATYAGQYAYRTEEGTYFIQELCKVIDENVNTDSLTEMIRKVTEKLATSEDKA